MLSVSSNSPITVSKDGVSKVYDKWIIRGANVLISSEGSVALQLMFCLASISDSGVAIYDPMTIVYNIADLLNDPDLGASSAGFFQAVVQKAMGSGIIA